MLNFIITLSIRLPTIVQRLESLLDLDEDVGYSRRGNLILKMSVSALNLTEFRQALIHVGYCRDSDKFTCHAGRGGHCISLLGTSQQSKARAASMRTIEPTQMTHNRTYCLTVQSTPNCICVH